MGFSLHSTDNHIPLPFRSVKNTGQRPPQLGNCMTEKWQYLNTSLPLVMFLIYINPWIYPAFANSVDPDQLASEEANWSGSALFDIQYVNLVMLLIWQKYLYTSLSLVVTDIHMYIKSFIASLSLSHCSNLQNNILLWPLCPMFIRLCCLCRLCMMSENSASM